MGGPTRQELGLARARTGQDELEAGRVGDGLLPVIRPEEGGGLRGGESHVQEREKARGRVIWVSVIRRPLDREEG